MAHMRESIDFMGLAFEQAEAAGKRGEVPIGAVLVDPATGVLAAAGNEVEALGDPAAHAELLALRAATAALGAARLTDCDLYVTLEPCPMCAGALVAARVARLVFAAPDPKAGACGSLYNLCVDPRLNHEIRVDSGVLGAEAAELLSGWFADRRNQRGG